MPMEGRGLHNNGLAKKYLKVGVLDNGELMLNEEGSAQGNIISLLDLESGDAKNGI